MKVFVTGATGYVGSAVARALADAGHDVWALGRSDEAVARLAAEGYHPVPGDLRDVGKLEDAARLTGAVVHAAQAKDADTGAVDEAAVDAFLRGLAGSRGPLVYTSGVWVLGSTDDDVADEAWSPNPAGLVAWRARLEKRLVEAAGRGVRTVVIRPAIVYGRGGGIPAMVARGDVPVIGDGRQRWPVVHVEDLAALYVAALDRAPTGSVLHGATGEITMGDLARLARGPDAARRTLDEARATFGAFADALALDQRVTSRKTRERVGWRPGAPSVVEELLDGSYA